MSGNYDIWFNLLKMPSDEEIGRAVKKKLLEKQPEKGDFSYREIIIGGS